MTNHVRLTLSRNRGFDLQALSLATNGLLAVVVARPTPRACAASTPVKTTRPAASRPAI